ncbi:hypothetical protein H0H92_002288 [Tricholoma furcatifolium]|nr:hypothetical protein H0H92_002288 [Tricholoma furcatifolium]
MLNFFHRRQAGQKKRAPSEDIEDDSEGFDLKEIASPRPTKRSKSSLEDPLLRPSSLPPPPQKSSFPASSALTNEGNGRPSSRLPSPASPAPFQPPWLPASYLSSSSSIAEQENGQQLQSPTSANLMHHWAPPSDSRAFPLAPHTRSNLDGETLSLLPSNRPGLRVLSIDPFKEATTNVPSSYNANDFERKKSFAVTAHQYHVESTMPGGWRSTNNKIDRTSLRQPEQTYEQEGPHFTANDPLGGIKAELLDVMKDPPPIFQANLIATTQRLAGRCGLYPTCYELRDITEPDASKAALVGGFADIFKGTFRGRPVCLKTIRRNKQVDLERFMKVVSKEAILWGQLRHPNLLPFYGIYRFKNSISLVSPWMEHGNVNDFLTNSKDSNRVILTYDVAKGLEFLHQHDIIHGDLKGANVLVNEHGRICLGDFGLSSVSSKEIVAFTSVSTMASKGGTVRWQAPELFNHEADEDTQNTKSSDIYAWACVAYEIFAGEVPFAQLSRETTIMHRVANGHRPTRPLGTGPSWRIWGLTETIWTLMESCWHVDPTKRPTIGVVITQLETGLPQGQDKYAYGAEHLSPGQFREMARSWSDGIELSVAAFERLFET